MKLAAFFCCLLPYMVFFLKASLLSHLILATGMVLVGAMVFNIRLFVSSYMTLISYLAVTLGQIFSHVLAFGLHERVDITGILTYAEQPDIGMVTLGSVVAVILLYQSFVRFFKDRYQRMRTRPRVIVLINSGGVAALLVLSNLYLRFLSDNAPQMSQIPKLVPLLVAGYFAMALVTFVLMYLLNLTVVSQHHLNEVREYAERDIQTGVLNRHSGLDMLSLRMRESRMKDKPLAICFVDINNLKQVNDKLGHAMGDALIEVVSETIRKSLRNLDFVCRLGGDEFLIVYCDCTLAQAKSAWNRIYGELCRCNENPQQNFPVSVSYGFAEYNALSDMSVKDFIEQADAQMYAHKTKYKQIKKNRQRTTGTNGLNLPEVLE